jgi:hypothetical protein
MTTTGASAGVSTPNQPPEEKRRRDLERARAFVLDRVAAVRAHAALNPRDSASAQFLVHLVPLGREDAVVDDLADRRWDFLHGDLFSLPGAGDGPSERFNQDGYLLQYGNASPHQAFVLFLRNGGVEFGTNHIVRTMEDVTSVDGQALFEVFRRTIPALITATQRTRGIVPPFGIFISLIGVDGVPLSMPAGWIQSVHASNIANRIDGAEITMPALVLEQAPQEWKHLLPQLQILADRTWQCAGFPRAPSLR